MSELTLAGIKFAAHDLIERAIRAARPHGVGVTAPRWSAVCDSFAVGSSVAWDLCKAFNFDPDEKVTGSICERCEEDYEATQDLLTDDPDFVLRFKDGVPPEMELLVKPTHQSLESLLKETDHASSIRRTEVPTIPSDDSNGDKD